MSTRVLQARSAGQSRKAAKQAAKALAEGLLVAFPTETVYGIGAIATDAQALARLRQIKSRPKRPFSVHIAQAQDAYRYLRDVPRKIARLMRRSWPGPVTILVPVGGRFADAELNKAGLYEVLCAEDTIALRCPDDPVARSILGAVEAPVVATSANKAGAVSPTTARDVLDQLDGQIDLLVDAGPTRFGKDSTIVRWDGRDLKVVRRGVLDGRCIRELARLSILFVCTGNTCRSPMAAGLAKQLLAERIGCNPSALTRHGVEVLSAGLFAARGSRASREALEAVRDMGVDISSHRSRKIGVDLVQRADMILCMTDFQVAEVRRLVPQAEGRVRRLDPEGDIPDPIGLGIDEYRKTAQRIRDVLARVLGKDLL